jgi:peptide-methionine (R)-S-oxide reductase
MKLNSFLYSWIFSNVVCFAAGFQSFVPSSRVVLSLNAENSLDDGTHHPSNRGAQLANRRSIINIGGVVAASLIFPNPSNAMNSKNRSDGYAVQHTDREWAYILSGQQYNILRQGGTERPNSSILEGDDRAGEFRCAGCATPLFASASKFHSGTGWPSFASPLAGVETENVNPVQAGLLGAEVRCGTCGGHLGDVFSDGLLFVNTPAFATGKRYCVDGAALIFKPSDGSEDVFGDLPPPKKKSERDIFAPPKINSRDR